MEPRDIGLAILMVFSAVMLTYKWLSLYDNVDVAVIFFAFLLTLSLGGLLISIELRMQKIMEEFENTKRVIAVNSDNLEERIENKIAAYVDALDERLDRIERRMYR
ncbi:hypothetical protein DRP05_04275 [Archaeoglobales archaeon]|nr:MAG: hypothetical protein DRP05_04275 [Archaeoglobales archaeon]